MHFNYKNSEQKNTLITSVKEAEFEKEAMDLRPTASFLEFVTQILIMKSNVLVQMGLDMVN